MPHSFSTPTTVNPYAPSSSSSSRSSHSSTRNHSPPPLWSATDKIILQIKHFLDNDCYGSNDLVLSATPVEFAAFQRELQAPCFLHPHQVPSVQYAWNRQTNKLTVSCMPGLVHDAIIPLLVYFKEEIPTSNPSMTLRERRAIMFISGTDVLLFANPATSIITGRGKNVNGVYKQPDAAFKFAGNHGAARNGFPRVVFEVAFSQTYESVLEDARQWLVRAKGAIKLCVIVKLYEQPNRYKEIDYTEIEPKLIEQQLVREMFDAQKTVQAQAASPDASTNNSADSSSTESYDERMDSVAGRALFIHSVDEHAAWVGTLTGFMEFYRLSEDHSGIERDGPRYDIFNPTGPDPVLRISDLLPAEAIEGDPNRAYPLLLAEYRRYLDIGVEEMALARKFKAEQAKGKTEGNDAEYQHKEEESDGAASGGSRDGGDSVGVEA